MKTKIIYRKELRKLHDAAEQELTDALRNFPDERYDFITEDEIGDKESLWNLPIVGIENCGYGGGVKFIYVTSVSLGENGIDVTGVDNEEELPQFGQELYSLNEVLDFGIYTIIDSLPNGNS